MIQHHIKHSVLIVDDDNLNITALTQILTPDYKVYAAKNGQDAIKVAQKFLPSVVLLDIVMPEMDGYEVLNELKKIKETQTIPIIFVTGLRDIEDEKRGLSLGAEDYIHKPFNPEIIRLRIYNHIKVREAENLTALMLDSSPMGIHLTDDQYNIIDVSQTVLRMFGVEDKEQYKSTLYKNVLPEYQPNGEHSLESREKHLKTAFEKGYHHFEWMYQSLDGELIPCETTIVRAPYGDRKFVVSHFRDLREEKKMQAAINKAAKYRDTLLDAIETMIVITDIKTDDILYINDKLKVVLGFEENVIDKKCWEVLEKGAARRCVSCPKSDPECYSGKTYVRDFYDQATNRSYRIVSRVIDWADGSKVLFTQYDDITGIRTAIIERQQAIDKAQAEEERNAILEEAYVRLQAILNMLPIGVRIVSMEDYSLLYANKALAEMFGGESFEEALGQSVLNFMPEEQADDRKTIAISREYLDNDMPTMEVLCKRLNGETFPCRLISTEIHYKGVPASLAVVEDMTAEDKYRRALINAVNREREANQLKSNFLANMSHEIRTPMNAILGIAEIELRNEEPSSPRSESLSKIYESGHLLLGIINDILDLSKIEANRLEILPVPYDLPTVIDEATQMIIIHLGDKPIELDLIIDENTPRNLFGDELRLKQILNNILSNAFKYTEEGKVELAVWVDSHMDEDVVLAFRVSDTGQGMTQEQMDRLFEEYTRFNMDSNRAVIGTGLGMNITKRLLGLMGGEISVTSTPGKGSIFTVLLPQKRMDSVVCGTGIADKLWEFRFQRTPIHKKIQLLHDQMPYGKVLVVDDVESNVYVTKGMLIPYGLHVETVSSGFAAIDKIKGGNEYDIIFMDHMMPRMNGIEATKILRSMGYTGYIIALTANALTGQAKIFLQSGFDKFLSKPIDSRELNAVLNELIRNKKSPEALNTVSSEELIRTSQLEDLFLMDAKAAIEVLEEIYAKYHTTGVVDIELYEVTVHGMKSALNNIGNKELAGVAYRLEKAAQEGNFAIIKGETHLFVGELKAMVEQNSTSIKRKGIDKGRLTDVSDIDAVYLRESLYEIKVACVASDKDAAKMVMGDLREKKWPVLVSDILDEINVCLLHGALTKATAAIEGALNDLF